MRGKTFGGATLVVMALAAVAWGELPRLSGEQNLVAQYGGVDFLTGRGFLEVEPVAVVVTPPADLPADAKELLTGFDGEAAAIRKKAEQEIQTRREALIQSLKQLQDKYTRDAKLDEAVAIRDHIRELTLAPLKRLPNPGSLYRFSDKIGQSFFFEAVGRTGYTIWGTEVYTCDSDLGTAAVHAGVLKIGQKGIVKVTIVKSPETHQGTTVNGVSSSSWGSYPASYTVEAVRFGPRPLENSRAE